MNVTVGNQIHASDVDWRIILLQIVEDRTLWIRKFTGTHKSQKIVCTDLQKQIIHNKYRSKRFTEDTHIYGTYVFQCINT